jgi:hypothetical protein
VVSEADAVVDEMAPENELAGQSPVDELVGPGRMPMPVSEPLCELGNRTHRVAGVGLVIEIPNRGVLIGQCGQVSFVDRVQVMLIGGKLTLMSM